MSTKMKQSGDILLHTAAATVASGGVVVIGVRIGVAETDIANGAVGAIRVQGVHTLPKKSGDTFAQGALCYWDATNAYLTSTTTSNTLAGYAAVAAVSADVTMAININA